MVTSSADTVNGNSNPTLRDAILYANANPGTTITFSSAIAGQTITLTSELPLILGSGTVINGGSNNVTVSGANSYRVFFVGGAGLSGPGTTTATIENLTISHANAAGGNGSGGGGGGAGLGGAVFVSSSGALTVSNLTFSSNAATGGASGNANSTLVGGGGGMGGNGGAVGGGGFGSGATGSQGFGTPGVTPGNGAFTGGAPGGFVGGANGGGGATNSVTGGGGGVGGGNGVNGFTGGNGGFGGGGGVGTTGGGGNGGFGGGGAGDNATAGNGGFGGGGGGTFAGGTAGTGGFGGGNGSSNFTIGPISLGSGAGGGGAGMGGALFVQNGGSLTVAGAVTESGSTVTGGAGSLGAGNGSAFGSGMFLQGNGTFNLSPGSGNTQTFSGSIADQTGSGGTGPNAGSWMLNMTGGTLVLNGNNTYSGGTALNSGTIVVGNNSALGIGTLSMADSTTLSFSNAASFSVANTIAVTGTSNFTPPTGTTQTISGSITDGTSAGSIVVGGGGTLALSSGSNSYSGSTTINSGATLALTGAGTIQSSSVLTANGTFDISGASFGGSFISTLAGSGSVQLGSNILFINAGSTEFSGNLVGTSSSAFVVSSGTQTLSGGNSGFLGGVDIDDGATLALKGKGSIANSRGVFFDGFVNPATFDISQVNNGASIAGLVDTSGLGVVSLGAQTLTITGNLVTSTGAYLGIIQDGGIAGGTGGGVTVANGALAAFGGVNTYTGLTTINGGGELDLVGSGSISTSRNVIVNGVFDISGLSGGTQIMSLSGASAGVVNLGGNALTITNANGTFAGSIKDGGAFGGSGGSLIETGTGTLALSGANTYSGGTTLSGGTLLVGNNQALGTGGLSMAAGTTFGSIAGSFNVANAIQITGATNFAPGLGSVLDLSGTISNGGAAGSLTMAGPGVLILSGTNSYTGSTTVNGGMLEVDGSIASSSAVFVNAGGILSGTGIVDPVSTQIANGGMLAPGNASNPTGTLTITGGLAFTSGALYFVQVTSSASARTNVGGAAFLAGSVLVDPLSRITQTTTYTILSASALNGTFDSVRLVNNFAGDPTLSYSGNNVLLTLGPGLLSPGLPSNANGNQRGLAGALDNAVIGGSNLPAAFNALFALTGSGLQGGLTQLSGETAAGSQQTTFNAMGQFMGMMTDPFMGRGGGINGSSSATGYAEEASAYAAKSNPNDAFAFAKAPLAKVYDPRWSVWASGFGGSQSTSGNAAAGSNNTTSSIFGTAVGADYLFSPNTIAGFAMAGGGTSFSVANGGTGRSDLFQAGAYVRHNQGPAYISASLAYGWQDITTNRTVSIAGLDQLRAQFNANAWSGRLEGGYRLVAPWTGGIGITPYAAAQFVTFDLPAYAEQAVVGTNNFALAYGARDVTDARSELGIRTDKSWLVDDGMLLLRGRLAWAHDFDPGRSIGATFQSLPGASFVVNGAAQAADSALTTASVEMKWRNGWSAAATFEGEFSAVTNSYAGKGVIRYQW